MPRKLTTYDRERESIWLDLVESGESTTAEIAALAGLTQRSIQMRISRARHRREYDADPRVIGIGDAPVLHLVTDIRGQRGDWYHLPTDITSRDLEGGPVLVPNAKGTGLLRQRLGTGDPVQAPARSKAKFQPKKQRAKHKKTG
jgi:hypothetical protein